MRQGIEELLIGMYIWGRLCRSKSSRLGCKRDCCTMQCRSLTMPFMAARLSRSYECQDLVCIRSMNGGMFTRLVSSFKLQDFLSLPLNDSTILIYHHF